ncbi:MAG: ROK family protein [archaeon]
MKYAIGIDLGGTKIEGILMDEKGRVLNRYRTSTQAHKPLKVIVGNIMNVVKHLKERPIKGVGIGIPGFILPNGKLACANNVPGLDNQRIKKVLEKSLRTKVFIENDANCFALAEHKFGAGKGTKNMIGMIIGTGIGSGLILDGKIYRGSIGAAGEIGYQILDPNGPHYSTLKGDFESWCSGPNIVKRYKKAGGKSDFHSPGEVFKSKERKAKKVMEETYDYLGRGIGNLINTLNPELIVLGGGVSNIPFYKEVNKAAKKYTNPSLQRYVKIVKNKLGDSAGVIGAAAFVFQN